jgi:hypothetical protein
MQELKSTCCALDLQNNVVCQGPGDLLKNMNGMEQMELTNNVESTYASRVQLPSDV